MKRKSSLYLFLLLSTISSATVQSMNDMNIDFFKKGLLYSFSTKKNDYADYNEDQGEVFSKVRDIDKYRKNNNEVFNKRKILCRLKQLLSMCPEKHKTRNGILYYLARINYIHYEKTNEDSFISACIVNLTSLSPLESDIGKKQKVDNYIKELNTLLLNIKETKLEQQQTFLPQQTLGKKRKKEERSSWKRNTKKCKKIQFTLVTIEKLINENRQQEVLQIIDDEYDSMIDSVDYYCRSLLHYITTPFLVNVFLNMGANINVQDIYGNTPLHEAVLKKNKSMVTELLRLGADTRIANSQGNTPLDIAKSPDYNDIFFLIIGHNFRCALQPNNKLEHYNACNFFRELLDMGYNINNQDFNGDTFLHQAVCDNNIPMVTELLNLGANTSILNSRLETPLDIAKLQENKSLFNLIIRYNTNRFLTRGIDYKREYRELLKKSRKKLRQSFL